MAASTNNIDTLATGTVYGAAAALRKDLGKGAWLPLDVQVVEYFNNLTSLTAAVQTAIDAAFTTPKDIQSQTKVPADLKAGANFNFGTVPLGTSQKFVRIHYTVIGTAPTAGKVTAGFVAGLQTGGVASCSSDQEGARQWLKQSRSWRRRTATTAARCACPARRSC